jgi:hypothetical protein
MKNSSISIGMYGTACNEWPRIKIAGNNDIYYDGEVQGNKVVSFEMPLLDTNTLVIEHYGKKFGENGVWDVRTVGDTITQDRAVKINSIVIDQVELIGYLCKHWPLVTADDSVYTDYFGFNGQCTIAFSSPVYTWIIDSLVRPEETHKPIYDLAVETSFGNLFDYQQDCTEIAEIENLLKKHASVLDKSA